MQTKIISPELLAQLLSDKIQKAFWSKVKKRGPDECWPWTGIRFERKGAEYGMVYFQEAGESFRAHRMAYIFWHKKTVPDGLCVLHSCIGNPWCCNPKHLREGTHLENMSDKVNQNRQWRPIGELHHKAKLNNRSVLEIRSLYRSGKFTQESLAKSFGVGKETVGFIVRGQTWTHI